MIANKQIMFWSCGMSYVRAEQAGGRRRSPSSDMSDSFLSVCMLTAAAAAAAAEAHPGTLRLHKVTVAATDECGSGNVQPGFGPGSIPSLKSHWKTMTSPVSPKKRKEEKLPPRPPPLTGSAADVSASNRYKWRASWLLFPVQLAVRFYWGGDKPYGKYILECK